MRRSILAVVLLWGCGGNGGDTAVDAQPAGDGRVIDGQNSAPMITSFTATPAQVPAGVATDVTWSWTYAFEPTFPEPTCTINNNVGAVMRGQMTSVTISAVTTFTLTCTNSEGMASRQVVVAVPPAAPLVATFTATPATITPGQATSVTFAWTYTTPPSPAPACTIDGLGTVTSGMATSLTQTTSRVYRLRCTNSQGTGAAITNVNVDECAANTDDCQANATCTDTADGFTCACGSGFTGNGDVCSTQVACNVTPSPCSDDATCVNGTSCVCNATYVGDGLTCTRNRLAFTTSTNGTGNLSTWGVDAGGGSGLAAADAVCQARANAAGLGGAYVAWMSDSLNDAYCRANGFSGKKAGMCGQLALPTGAGPWVRVDGRPFAPTIDRLVAPGRTIYQPASVSEFGIDLGTTDRVYTGTDENGEYIANATCGDWTTTAGTGAMGEVHGSGGGSWTDSLAAIGSTDPSCATTGRLRCVQRDGTAVPLPSRHPVAKKAFVTSVTGTGNLSTWADASALTSLAAADAVCQARARFAGYANSATFKAWLSGSSSSASTRIVSNGPWARPDGVIIGTSEVDIEDARLGAALYQTELGTYVPGTADTGNVWTGTSSSGSLTSISCTNWTSTTSTGTLGRHDLLTGSWTSSTTATCSAEHRLYCLEDL
jgi:hypothetical protein